MQRCGGTLAAILCALSAAAISYGEASLSSLQKAKYFEDDPRPQGAGDIGTIKRRRNFYQIHRLKIQLAEDKAKKREHVARHQPPRHWESGSRRIGRIEDIDVQRKVDAVLLIQGFNNLLGAAFRSSDMKIASSDVKDIIALQEIDFLGSKGTQPHQGYFLGREGGVLKDTSHYAGMIEMVFLICVPKIGVSV